MNTNNQAPYEHGFMLSLLLLAIGGLIWLFSAFIPSLFLALLIAIASLDNTQNYRLVFLQAYLPSF